MARKTRRPDPSPSGKASLQVVLACALLFGVLAMLPTILPALHIELHPTAPQSSYGVPLMVAPKTPRSVDVPAVARPVAPDQAPAALPKVDAAREAATVAAEDKRLRTVLHSATRVFQPEIISVRGSLPTLVLTAASSAYTAKTLVEYGALVMLPHNAALLIDNVYVAQNAKLALGGAGMRTLYLDSGSGGFATIVAWGGNLTFAGTARTPMTILGWDRANSTPAADQGYGRPYIREVAGRMTFANVRVSSLGFWSGRTGGVAWTGLTSNPSTGGAVNSTFTGDTYGSFVSRGSGVTFRSDLFEYNQLDGMHVHRYSVHTKVTYSSAVRNGGNGFIVSPASENTVVEDDIAEHNAGNGFLLNGRPLATGASASGNSAAPSSGTAVEYSSALDNGKIGVLVEGGVGTVIKGDQVCGGITAIEVKDGASDAVVTGNTVSCAPKSGISVGPSAPGTVLSGNAVNGARTAFLIRNSGPVQFDKNVVTGATVFGISARGVSSAVNGVGNTISGSGFRAVDSRADAPTPSLYASNLSGWTYHAKVTFVSYLMFHPLAALWLGIVTMLALGFLWTRALAKRKAGFRHPYPQSTRWHSESAPVEAAAASAQPARALATLSAPAAPAPAAPAPAVPTFRSAGAARQDGYATGSPTRPERFFRRSWQASASESQDRRASFEPGNQRPSFEARDRQPAAFEPGDQRASFEPRDRQPAFEPAAARERNQAVYGQDLGAYGHDQTEDEAQAASREVPGPGRDGRVPRGNAGGARNGRPPWNTIPMRMSGQNRDHDADPL